MLFPGHPIPFSVGRVVVQQLNLVFWHEQTSAKGISKDMTKVFFMSPVN